MYLLRNNKIIHISLDEDCINNKITAIKSVEQLHKESLASTINDSIVKDKIFTLGFEHAGKTGTKDGYLFRITQSQYSDNSGLKGGMGVHTSKGEAIKRALELGYKVFNGDIEITL